MDFITESRFCQAFFGKIIVKKEKIVILYIKMRLFEKFYSTVVSQRVIRETNYTDFFP